MKCVICGRETHTDTIPLCPKCSKEEMAIDFAKEIHDGMEKIKRESDVKCNLCSNECGLFEGETGLCRLRWAENNKLKSLVNGSKAILYSYEDKLPTNCCNSWFCKGTRLKGTNLAVFYYGCNFDCLYCQNWEHKMVEQGKIVSVNEMVNRAMKERIKCICHFGGSPEPQLAFAINFSKKVLEKRDIMICWEWNGAGRKNLVLKAAELSSISGGTVKFDLKAWNENLHYILTGRSNKETLKNFERIFEKYPEVLSATTLLVPYYVDKEEVKGIASFLASLDESIPYSLLVFHPDYRLSDLPITPKSQVFECYDVARRYLKKVNIGNLHLLGWIWI